MRVSTMVNGVAQYLSEAIARIFGPRDDAYPETGFQPFTGEIASRSSNDLERR